MKRTRVKNETFNQSIDIWKRISSCTIPVCITWIIVHPERSAGDELLWFNFHMIGFQNIIRDHCHYITKCSRGCMSSRFLWHVEHPCLLFLGWEEFIPPNGKFLRVYFIVTCKLKSHVYITSVFMWFVFTVRQRAPSSLEYFDFLLDVRFRALEVRDAMGPRLSTSEHLLSTTMIL